jgi:hypothetical protein
VKAAYEYFTLVIHAAVLVLLQKWKQEKEEGRPKRP